ncbi:putative cytokinetic ring protein SteA [Petroclostridium sp. X23]|uniref:putative cytokinetic ring protein SteA n=1 Tax=Petroclostridium sp. X23 TaxID=3045146 RepID=UPI0024AD3CD6|nr:putative cytokinetic ring protein SteA [Petroclostridium sp. X23]WHH59912.1 putative cytokinetic ring protein SteA [Petroclostridium sp. X23]
MTIKGYAKKGKKTKELVKRLSSNSIPVICHQDLDEVAAYSLIEAKVKAVINCDKSISGRYPTKGTKILIDNGIIVVDDIGEKFYNEIQPDELIEIKNYDLYINGERYEGSFNMLDTQKVDQLIEHSYHNFSYELERFIDNTLEYASREKDIILKNIDITSVETQMENRHVLIVVRGCNYKQDLQIIKEYIKDVKPVLIGVDGGGDALMEFGLTPDMIVGDMDSISDECLKKGKEIIVHAYSDGRAPGMERINKLGLEAKIFPFTGTSEDAAMMIAYEKRADLIIAVGTHSNIIDFLEKGRKGMASTMLTRLKIGSKLVDAKGVSKLYSNKLRLSYCIPLLFSALIPIIAIIKIYIPIQVLLNIFQFRLRMK